MCTCVWKPEAELACCPSEAIHLVFRDGLSLNVGDPQVCQASWSGAWLLASTSSLLITCAQHCTSHVNVHMCDVSTCLCTYVSLCTCVSICVSVSACVCSCVCVCMCMHICVYMCACVCVCECICVHMHLCVHV